jgi:hypothetical protein
VEVYLEREVATMPLDPANPSMIFVRALSP